MGICQTKNQTGSVFFALFGAVVLVGILIAGVMAFMKGPLGTSILLTKSGIAQNQMTIAAQVAVMSAANGAGGGDCDSDGTIEPIEWRSATTEPYPTGGGLIPLTFGVNTKDPWGTEYGYCAWNYGTTISGSGCGANLLAGTDSQSYPVVALVSAGPDRTFTTTCRDFATADVNTNGSLSDAGDLPLIGKNAATDDDIIYKYTYEEAVGAAGGLWGLKSSDINTAAISKSIEVGGNATVSGSGTFTDGALLPTSDTITCDALTTGAIARNAAGDSVELCDGSSWQSISGSGTTYATPAVVQTTASARCTSSCTSRSATFATTPTAGNTVIVILGGIGTGSSACLLNTNATISDNKGNTYTKAVASTDSANYAPGVGIWYSPITTTSATFTVTASVPTSCESSLRMELLEVSGIAASSPVDQIVASGNEAFGTTLTKTTGVTTQANEFAVAGYENGNDYGTMSSISAGWTALGGDGNAYNLYEVLSSVGAVGNTWDWTTSSQPVGAIATFKAASSGGVSGSALTVQLPDETVNTNGMCDGSHAGLLRYNTSGTSTYMDPATGGPTSGAGSYSSITYVGEAHDSVDGPHTVTLTVPAGMTAGDLLVYVSSVDNSSGGFTWPSGFTQIASRVVPSSSPDMQKWAAAYKISDGSETTLSVTDTAGSNGMAAALLVYRGVDPSTPVATYSSALAGSWPSATSWNVTATTITPTIDGSKAVFFASADTNSGSSTLSYAPPSGYTERVDFQGADGWTSLAVFDNDVNAGATGSVVGNMASSFSIRSRTGAIFFALNPEYISSSGGGGPGTASASNYAEVCDGSSWVKIGRFAFDDFYDVITNYTASTTAYNASIYSMFLGQGSGALAEVGAGYNTALGYESMVRVSTGTNNTAMGYRALLANSTGTDNSSFGSSALMWNSTGSYNSAFGYEALYNNSGSYNSAFGAGALYSNRAKSYNTAVGYQSQYFADSTPISSSSYNTSVGYQALMGGVVPWQNTGINNTAVGYQALFNNTAGSRNSASGAQALYSNTTGNDNTALGYQAAFLGTTANDVTALGYQALYNNNGDQNTAIGSGSLYSNVAKYGSTAIGYHAMYYADDTTVSAPTYNTAIGSYAMQGSATASDNTGTYNTAIGHSSMKSITSGSYNTAMGAMSLYSLEEGNYNTADGAYALYSAVNSSYNTAYGSEAMRYVYSGTSTASDEGFGNTALGYQALMMDSTTVATNTANYNVAIGAQSMSTVRTVSNSVAVGYGTLKGRTGGGGIAIGYEAMGDGPTDNKAGIGIGYRAAYSNIAAGSIAIGANALDASATSTDTGNIAIGRDALTTANSADTNVAVGHSALASLTTGTKNTAVGYQAGFAGTAITDGSNNTFIGYQAQSNGASYTNGTAIGNGAVLTGSNRIVLGNTAITQIRAQVTSITAISDRRHKKDITEDDLGLAFIDSLMPVSYRFNNGDETLRYGFIAQDIEKSLPETLKPLVNKEEGGLALVTRDHNDEGTYHVSYGELIAPIVKAVQELDKKLDAVIETLSSFIKDTKTQIAELFESSKELQLKRAEQDKEIEQLETDLRGLKLSCAAGGEK